MRPDERDLEAEIRSHLALSVRERIERGEDPEVARLAALREFGYVPAIRDSMRRVWYSRWFEAALAFGQDTRVGLRSLVRARGLAATVVVTLALGIGANAAIFSVVRGVLLRPLVNREEDRLVYIRQSAPGLGIGNLTFSVPEIADLEARASAISAFGDFSTIEFPLVGLGEPRVVRAGVVSGSYFEVMGLRPVLGRLLTRADDGPTAAGAAVLTHRFWTTALASDGSVVGRTIRLGSRTATVVGVLEPSVPYPADTEIIANMVTSPHHLEATMVTGRTHRMTELFGRLAPGRSLEDARAELTAVHTALMEEHPEAYASNADVRLEVRLLRDQIATPARAILLVLLFTSGVVFIIACANVASLILARSVHREGELAVRAALGASRGALRRTLLAESLVLCGAGAVLGVLMARPLVALVARFASRFSVRALEVTVDGSLLWVGAGLAMAAAVLLAYIPRLPSSPHPDNGYAAGGGIRMTPNLNRRLKTFAVAQVACSFVLLSAAGALLGALVALQSQTTGLDARQVLAIDVPLPIESFGPKSIAFYDEARRRIGALPGVSHVAVSNVVPWRDAGTFGPFPFAVEGRTPSDGGDPPHALLRNVTPGFFDALGIPIVAGRDFTEDDRGRDRVAIVSRGLAESLFPDGHALDHRVWWTDPVFGAAKLRVVGVVADVYDDDVHPRPTPAFTIYHPLRQVPFGGRLLVRAAGDPYALVPVVTRVIREISADQPVEHAATLEDIRAQVLAPERVNAFVVAGFAGVALLIAVVGVAGVLAFSVSARTREFGVRLAVGSSPRSLLVRIVREGVSIVLIGIAVGVAGGYVIALLTPTWLAAARLPGAAPALGAAALLAGAAMVASLIPAVRAARVDVVQALRSE
jgi:predicted permease